MIVITTPTGQIGRQVLGNLLDSGEQLRVIARDPSQLPAEVREDLGIVEGSHGDAAVVDKAFAGADAVFWLTPADPRAPSVDAAFAGFTRPHNVNRPEDRMLDGVQRNAFETIAGAMQARLGYVGRPEYVVNY